MEEWIGEWRTGGRKLLGERLDGNNGVEVWSFRFKRRREGQCELRLYLMEGEETVELVPALLRCARWSFWPESGAEGR